MIKIKLKPLELRMILFAEINIIFFHRTILCSEVFLTFIYQASLEPFRLPRMPHKQIDSVLLLLHLMILISLPDLYMYFSRLFLRRLAF